MLARSLGGKWKYDHHSAWVCDDGRSVVRDSKKLGYYLRAPGKSEQQVLFDYEKGEVFLRYPIPEFSSLRIMEPNSIPVGILKGLKWTLPDGVPKCAALFPGEFEILSKETRVTEDGFEKVVRFTLSGTFEWMEIET